MSFSYLIRDLWKRQDEGINRLDPIGERFPIDRSLVFLPDVEWYKDHYKENLIIGLSTTKTWNCLCQELEYAIFDYYDGKGKLMPYPYPRFDEFIDYILEAGNVLFQSFYDGMLDRMIHGVRCTLPDGIDSLDWDLVEKLQTIAEKFKYYLF